MPDGQKDLMSYSPVSRCQSRAGGPARRSALRLLLHAAGDPLGEPLMLQPAWDSSPTLAP